MSRTSPARYAKDLTDRAPIKHGTADIMLHYVESGAAFTVEYGDINEPFYLSMERMYLAALKYLQKNRLLGEFESRCSAIVRNTSGVGWGFHDTLGDMYEVYYGSS